MPDTTNEPATQPVENVTFGMGGLGLSLNGLMLRRAGRRGQQDGFTGRVGASAAILS